MSKYTKARARFCRAPSEEFEIKTEVRQGDGLSPMSFSIADVVADNGEKQTT